MKGRSIYFTVCVSLIFPFSLLIGQSGKADYPPGNWRYSPQHSKQAGLAFYKGLSALYFSLYHLENGKITDANSVLKESAGFIYDAYSEYESILPEVKRETLKNPKIYENGIPSETMSLARKTFAKFKIEFPTNWNKLAEINQKHLGELSDLLIKNKYVADPHENRVLIMKLNEAIYRIMSLGVSISEIAS